LIPPGTPPAPAVLRRNNVVVQGHDHGLPALVFVNGFGCDQSVWRSVAPQFAPHRQIVLFDHVGSVRGQADAYDPDRYGSLQAYADDLLEVCDAAGVENAVLVGHSVGAMIGILAAIRWPAAFHQLILLSPSPCYLNDGSYLGGFGREDLDALLKAMDLDYPHWTHQIAPLLMGRPDRPELAWELESSFKRLDPSIARQFARLTFDSDLRQELAQLSTPTTVLQCNDDNMVPEVVGEFMQENIKDCQLLRLDTGGHFPHMSEPQEVFHVLRSLLQSNWAATEPSVLGSAF
jgi:sigma-B regulation protein RsbQ